LIWGLHLEKQHAIHVVVDEHGEQVQEDGVQNLAGLVPLEEALQLLKNEINL
jgi:hypothetical protein